MKIERGCGVLENFLRLVHIIWIIVASFGLLIFLLWLYVIISTLLLVLIAIPKELIGILRLQKFSIEDVAEQLSWCCWKTPETVAVELAEEKGISWWKNGIDFEDVEICLSYLESVGVAESNITDPTLGYRKVKQLKGNKKDKSPLPKFELAPLGLPA